MTTNLNNLTLNQALGDLQPAPREDFTVAAIYFPGFHRTPLHDAWFGWGWSEWELVRRCRPRFEGHRQPIEPLWGYFDESDPEWSAREVDAATQHGIDAWIVDWYWYSGIQILNEALANGFLRAPNRDKMKFGLMWANHTWANNFPAPQTGSGPLMLPIRHSLEDLDRVMDYCAERFFSQPNYWHIDGKPWFSFFLVSSLLEHLGGASGVAKAIDRMRQRAEQNGHGGLYLGCFTWSPVEARLCKDVGFDHITTYNVSASDKHKIGAPLDQYEDLMLTHVRRWQELSACGVPYWPVVTHGWDVSPRNHPYEPWPPVRWQWPWGHIVLGNTPERFGQLCYAARQFLSSQSTQPKVMVLNAWNEWTEGSVLLPTRDEGFAVLEALQSALKPSMTPSHPAR